MIWVLVQKHRAETLKRITTNLQEIRTTMSEMKHTLDEISSRLDNAEEKISEAEGKICKIKYKRKLIFFFLNEKAPVKCGETLSRLIYGKLEFLKRREG